jgi:CHAT domain-containing protein
MWSLNGVLRYIPMAALYDGRQYLVERYQNIVFIPESILKLSYPVRPNWEVLGLGVSQGIDGSAPLSGAERELRAIIRDQPMGRETTPRGILPGTIRLNRDFTLQAMIDSLRDGGYPVVHIATHYTFFPNDMKRSFLLLGDGRHLTMEELQFQGAIFAGVDLLALSACDTASVKAANGMERESLAVVAQKLGAKSVIASLWPVNDVGTDELMETFYRLRQAHPGISKAEALRHAQLSLLKGAMPSQNSDAGDLRRTTRPTSSSTTVSAPLKCEPKAKYCHPYYWAPFILIGNWK